MKLQIIPYKIQFDSKREQTRDALDGAICINCTGG